MLISQHDLKKLCHSLSLANSLSRASRAGGTSSLGRLLSVLSVCPTRTSEDMFAGSADAKATLVCASGDFFSTFFLRASNQGVLSFKRGYPLSREIFKTLEWGTDKTDRNSCGHLLSVL